MIPRCLVPTTEWLRPEVTLDADTSHHVLVVLRLRAGARVILFDGAGREALAEITATTGRRAVCRVLNRALQERPPVALTLIQALPKGTVMDSIVQKATEIGVSSIVPVITQRTVPRLDADRARARAERWQRIAAAAAAQCGSGWVPVIEPLGEFPEVLPRLAEFGETLLGSLDAAAPRLGEQVARLRERRVERVALVIGPEGDLTPAEAEAARGAGATPVSFGERILRVETAAVFGLSVLAHELLAQPSPKSARNA